LIWSLSLAGSCLAAFGYLQATPTFDAPGGLRTIWFALMGIFGFAMIFLAPCLGSRARLVCLLCLPALLLRGILLPVPPSDDVNRYVWEGQLVREGVSPYAHTADAPEWAAYRDSHWEAMNNKDKLTAYPPMAELLFAVTTQTNYPVAVFKLWVLAADVITLGGIVLLLRRRGLPDLYAGFYAFNPVVLVAFAAEAHFDIFMVAALVWGLWAYESGHKKIAIALATTATGLKWVTLPLLPFFSRFSYLRSFLIGAMLLIFPALFFWASLPQLFAGLFQFGSGGSFNGPVYELLFRGFDLSRDISLTLVVASFAGIILWRWQGRSRFAMDSQIRWVLGALIVFAPTVHFWYLAWVLPFVCLRPTVPWILLSISSGFYFMVWSRAADGSGWGLSVAQNVWFWAPFGVGLLYELWSTRGRCAFAPQRAVGMSPETVAVVIPTLNAEHCLARALQSVGEQIPKICEVIVVDGGSTDGTLAVAEAAPQSIKVLRGEKGRGNQIAQGIEAASSEWVIALHADARMESGSSGALLRAVRSMPQVIGGAFGQRFDGEHAELIPIEVLNDLRALFTRTSFGDQIQFFHRESAVKSQLMPAQPLMEDVESSWRIREQGEFLFLGYPGEVCHRRWRATGWLKRFALVMRLVTRYRVVRLSGRAEALRLSRELYHEYYD
jgi:hypothetical protein